VEIKGIEDFNDFCTNNDDLINISRGKDEIGTTKIYT